MHSPIADLTLRLAQAVITHDYAVRLTHAVEYPPKGLYGSLGRWNEGFCYVLWHSPSHDLVYVEVKRLGFFAAEYLDAEPATLALAA